MQDGTLRIPLRGRGGIVRGYATVDVQDAHLAEHNWNLHSGGYACRNAPRSSGRGTILLHREVLGLPSSCDETEVDHVDHVNRDRLDCRRCNLRIATHAQNAQNVTCVRGTSRHRNVSWDAGRRCWFVSARLGNRTQYIGRFGREEDAASAAKAWRKQHMPFAVEDE